MWQGNYGYVVQTAGTTLKECAAEKSVTVEGGVQARAQEMACVQGDASPYRDNFRLIAIAQSDDGQRASDAMGELIQLNQGLIRSIALRFRERGVEFEDLMQIGTIGMIKAVRNFDTSRGTGFSTYAVPLIFGEIRRHLRDEGLIKVGRYYKKLGNELMGHKNRIRLEEGREARIGELAELCSVSAEEAAMALDAMSPILSLSAAFGEEDGVELEEMLSDRESSEASQRFCERIALSQALKKMPEQWQRIVTFRFFRNLTQQQVADLLGLTQVKVSREEKKILAFLRTEML